MFDTFIKIATGRSHYSTLFLVIFMFIAPAAMFTQYSWLDAIGWVMTIILGIFILITGLVSWQEGRASHRWPRVKVKLKSAHLQAHSGSKGGMSYSPKVNCSFLIDGEEITGTEYDFSASYTSKSKAKKKVDEVKAMNPLLVHYKPEDPSINVIHPGVHFVAFLRVLIGLAAVIISSLSWSGYIQYG
jgi:hypothetical protein